jgi:hypothetical protein
MVIDRAALPADRPWREVAHSPEVLDFWPWALLIAGGALVAAVIVLIPVLAHARLAGRDHRSRTTPRNLRPLGVDPTVRVNDRVRDAVVQFDLPADLRPEQMAVLLHDGDPDRAIAAALLDLEAQGAIVLAEDRVVSATGPGLDASAFQQRLLRILRRDNTRFEWRDWALGALYSDATGRGWFTGRPDYTSYGPRLYAAASLTLGVIIALYTSQILFSGYWSHAFAGYAVAILLIAISFAFRYSARRRPNRSQTGRALAEQLAGFARAIALTGETRHTAAGLAEPGPESNWTAVRVALGVDRRSVRRLARNIPDQAP